SIDEGMGRRPTSPFVGFSPARPQNAAGIRTEPPPSVAVARGTIPAARAAPEPPLEPPGDQSRPHGLPVGPNAVLSVYPWNENSGTFVFPTTIAPAARRRSTTRASRSAGAASSSRREPFTVRIPA